MDYDIHNGPLFKDDLIVIEINGKLIPRRPNDKTPQVFIVTCDQIDNGNVKLLPFNDTKPHKVRKYIARCRH